MKKLVIFLTIVFCFAVFSFRLWLTYQSKHGDMYNNLSWGFVAARQGLNGFYELPKSEFSHSRPNQPPGSILLHFYSVYLFESVGALANRLNAGFPVFPSRFIWFWEQYGQLVSIKIPSLVGDFLVVVAILRLGRHFSKVRPAFLSALVYLLNPAVWYVSSFWGQTDGFLAGISALSVAALLTGNILVFGSLMGLSLITKASWSFVFAVCLVYLFSRHFHRAMSGLVAAGLTVVAAAVWFRPHWDLPWWLFRLYTDRILPGESSYLTVNSFNLWHLIFGGGLTPDSVPFLGLTAGIWGSLIVLAFLIYISQHLVRHRVAAGLPYWLAVLSFAVFLFAPRMHERYLFPFFSLFSLALIVSRRRRLFLFLLLPVSGLYLFNCYHLWWAPGWPQLVSLYTPQSVWSAALAYLLVFFPLIWVKSSHDS